MSFNRSDIETALLCEITALTTTESSSLYATCDLSTSLVKRECIHTPLPNPTRPSCDKTSFYLLVRFREKTQAYNCSLSKKRGKDAQHLFWPVFLNGWKAKNDKDRLYVIMDTNKMAHKTWNEEQVNSCGYLSIRFIYILNFFSGCRNELVHVNKLLSQGRDI